MCQNGFTIKIKLLPFQVPHQLKTTKGKRDVEIKKYGEGVWGCEEGEMRREIGRGDGDIEEVGDRHGEGWLEMEILERRDRNKDIGKEG